MKKLFIPLFIAITFLPFISCQNENTSGEDPVAIMEKEFDLSFSPSERDSLRESLKNMTEHYKALHNYSLANSVPPAIQFNPVPAGFSINSDQQPIDWGLKDAQLPENKNDLAFYTVSQLSTLIKTRQITSVELTEFYIQRLKKYSDTLHCLITLTENLAMEQARKADEEISNGHYRGPLHGIPFGVKDLLAVPGYKTTWGARPYENQTLDQMSTVVKKLEDAGGVLVAKLSMGALAMGDVWFGGRTRNPWNLEQGSSGSSAGSAAATAAGLLPFTIGTETLGSIVSPSTRCGATGLRPSYGRVSRYGAMALSWSMDKIGPICRYAEDCAIVFNTIRGLDENDPTLYDAAFNYQNRKDLSGLKIGYLKSIDDTTSRSHKRDSATLDVLRSLGATLVPVELPADLPVRDLIIILNAEAAAAFDELTRSNQDSLLVRQSKNAWPNQFRSARFIPAVEYIEANRVRTKLINEMDKFMQQFDLLVSPTFERTGQLLITNLTGQPAIAVPNGFTNNGSPTSITFVGRLFDEATILAVAKAYQDATDIDEQHPEMFKQ